MRSLLAFGPVLDTLLESLIGEEFWTDGGLPLLALKLHSSQCGTRGNPIPVFESREFHDTDSRQRFACTHLGSEDVPVVGQPATNHLNLMAHQRTMIRSVFNKRTIKPLVGIEPHKVIELESIA